MLPVSGELGLCGPVSLFRRVWTLCQIGNDRRSARVRGSRRFIHFDVKWKVVAKATLAAAVMGIVVHRFDPQDFTGVLGAVLAGVVTYAMLLFLLRTLSREDLGMHA